MCECEAHNGTPAFEERACVVSNENLGPRLYKITLAAPKTAAAILFRAMCDSPYLSRQEVL